MKLLITGASGLYGSKLAQIAAAKGHDVYAAHSQHEIKFGHEVHMDITNKAETEAAIKAACPDVVVHAATLTDVDKCELNRELACKINVEGTDNVATAAQACGAFLIYISTDYVFDGSKGCYRETDLPSPINYYGYTKLKAEDHVQKIVGDNCCIARASVIYGATPAAGKVNFAMWLLDKLKKGEQVKIVTDQWTSPTLNSSLAKMTLEAAERHLRGVFHMSGATRISRFDFATNLAKTFGLDESLILPTTSAAFSQPAKRPRDSSLDTSKAAKALQAKPLQIEEALAQLKAEIQN
jgi:dTDP-4-dehydrorhamnose reductase